MASRRGSHKELEKCGQCAKSVTEKDLGIQCELCENWFHATCEGMAEDVYRILGKTEEIHWFCKKCNTNVMKMLKTVGKLQDRVNKIEERQSETDAELKKINDVIQQQLIKKQVEYDRAFERGEVRQQSLESKINVITSEITQITEEINKFPSSAEVEDKLNEKMENRVPSFKDIVEREVEMKFTEVTENLTEVQKNLDETKKISEEEKDRDNRRNNIILYRIPESDAPLMAERNSADKRFCEQLFFGLNVGMAEEDIRRVIRLGKRGANPATPRPVLVQLGSHVVKNMVMESLYKLKSMSERFKNIIIAHDMTVKEREACKALVEEAKAKTENEAGEWIYRVRGPPGRMKIVQFRRAH